jgi:transcription antitermination factor NusA-like protein
MSKSRSRSRTPPIPQFPLILSFAASVLTDDKSQLKYDIIKRFKVDRLHISDEVTMTDGLCKLIYIYSNSLRAKLDSLHLLLESLYPDRSAVEVTVSYQNQLDPAVIASLPRTGATVQMMPEVKGYPERQAKVVGNIADVEKSVKEIHAYSIDKKPSPEPRTLGLEKTSAKFVVVQEAIEKIIGRNGIFPKRLKADFEVDLRIIRAEGQPCKENEQVVIVSGKFRHVRKAVKIVAKQVIEALEVITPNEQTLRLLIASTHVKELIGPQGSIIKEISRKAGNAKIKVLSDSKIEKCQDFTIVNIDGTMEARQEAACKVYELLGKNEKTQSRQNSPDEEELKIFVSVPDQYVARLIGRSGENVKAIMGKAKCKISFQKAPVGEIRAGEGERVRMCYVSGNSSSISKGVKLLLEQIAKLDAN